MPYITPTNRVRFDPLIGEISNNISDDDRDGELNYIVSSIIDNIYPIKYKSLNSAIGVLECIKQELYRRVVAPYEDTKISENGDVYGGLEGS